MRSQRGIKFLTVALLSVLVAACGGTVLGDDVGGGGDDDDVDTISAGVFTLQASSPQLSSDASEVSKGVKLTAILRDTDNNVITGAEVKFSTVDSGEIIVTNAVTDATGRATATLTTGGDPQNRNIRVKASVVDVEGKEATVPIAVVGTTLSISGLDNTQINVPTDYTVLLADAGGRAIPGITVSATTNGANTLTPASVATNLNGQATFRLTATVASSFVTASSLGLAATKLITVSTDEFTFLAPASNTEVDLGACRSVTVQWRRGGAPVVDGTAINFVATRGQLFSNNGCTVAASSANTGNVTAGSGQARIFIRSLESGFSQITASSTALSRPTATLPIEFVATDPASIDLQLSPATIATNQTSEISVVVRDAANNLVKNIPVDFTLVDITGGVISPAQAITNSQGLAKSTYTSSTQSSARDGVRITATVNGTAISDEATLTVGSRAISISFGSGAELQVPDISTYQAPFTVVVSDAAGNPAPDASFRLSASPFRFLKGTRSGATVECLNEDRNRNGILDLVDEDLDNDGVIDPGEDVNGDGVLNTTEDTNGNGRLEPGVVGTVPPTIDLDDVDGSGQFFLTYAKDFGEFVIMDITATAAVAGTESTAVRRVLLKVTLTDAPSLDNESPFGTVLNCSSPD